MRILKNGERKIRSMNGMIESAMSIAMFAFVLWVILIGIMIYGIIKLYFKKFEVEDRQSESANASSTVAEQNKH